MTFPGSLLPERVLEMALFASADVVRVRDRPGLGRETMFSGSLLPLLASLEREEERESVPEEALVRDLPGLRL